MMYLYRNSLKQAKFKALFIEIRFLNHVIF